MSLRKLSNQNLDSHLKFLVANEREVLTQILLHIVEVERRKLYLTFGYASLFSYLTEDVDSDDLSDIQNLARFLKPMKNVQKVQILPFHKMGEFKWKELGLSYELSSTRPPSNELAQQVSRIFQEQNIIAE
ncbi:MAG: hypothetical protein B7Y39_11835 [Bdellovibrio sp. 28-41-41]|nr:MAG: hypothetical protein B7Y39_11835 [Bdellovibrio sp. 28-41-41]